MEIDPSCMNIGHYLKKAVAAREKQLQNIRYGFPLFLYCRVEIEVLREQKPNVCNFLSSFLSSSIASDSLFLVLLYFIDQFCPLKCVCMIATT